MEDRTGSVSHLLRAWGRGDLQARDELVPVVYRELRRRAGAYLRRERSDHTLQPTALVHEAYLRLTAQERVTWQNRAHFFAIAAQMMRRVLIDHAREHLAAKRPGAQLKVLLDDRIGATQPRECELMMVDEALVELTRIDPRQGQIVELRYFGGLSEKSPRCCRSRGRRSPVNGNPPGRGCIVV
jgi:RNA polymerase sigma-70 factor (ECF subfamily)